MGKNPGQEMGPLLQTLSNGLNTGPKRLSNFNALVGPADIKKKLLTMRRKMLLDVKRFLSFSELKNDSTLDFVAMQFIYILKAYDTFCKDLDNISYTETLKQLAKNISDQFGKCQKVMHG